MFPRHHGQLLPALHYLQSEFGHLPDWAMEVVSWHLGIPASEVYGAATSYTELRIEKPGDHTVMVCAGLSCRANGASEILESLQSRFDIHPGSPTADQEFALEEVPCSFVCGLAPTMALDGVWHGRITVDRARSLVDGAARP
ncbi:MAG: NAD(P)H-dependent oxidoreductase subunit E [SAR202 cluster bacterium]|jgi:NADH:ubiquinone oxidoreductase subunit E|nr:NAD(P)H-dependent oxidoreductase subunit E [SAR202 cluster bacterium]